MSLSWMSSAPPHRSQPLFQYYNTSETNVLRSIVDVKSSIADIGKQGSHGLKEHSTGATVRLMTIELRPAIASDRRRVCEISSQIWNGDDYVPELFDQWLRDASGEFVVALLDGELIGFAHRTWLYPGHAWFEGIRTDPQHRGKGAGRAITAHLIEAAGRDGANAISLSTHIDNRPAIHIIESHGFRRVASFSYLEKQPDDSMSADPIDTNVVAPSEEDTARFVDRSLFLERAQRRFPRGWRFFPFDLDPREAVARLATRVAVRRGGRFTALACVRERTGTTEPAMMNFADGDPDDLRRLLGHIHRLYAGRRMETMIPMQGDREAPVLPLLRELGYQSCDGDAPAVFAYGLILSARPDGA
jgi:ribosomal protein S18 acetylase RimI-like enzyme